MEKISPPVRILVVLLVLAGTAGMLALRTLGPQPTDPVPVAAPAAKPKTASATPAAAEAPPAARAAAQPAAPAPKPASPASGFPAAVDGALRKHEIVVVSLVVPGARVDELAAAEARAGASLGGAGFLALNVLNERVARALLAKIDAIHNPSVLVLRRPGDVVLKLDGFADRETVAQAAASAAS